MRISGGTSARPVGRVSTASPTTTPGPADAPALGEHERGERQEEEQRLRVDGLEEERRREEREVEDGPAAAVGAEPFLRDALQQHERRERREQ